MAYIITKEEENKELIATNKKATENKLNKIFNSNGYYIKDPNLDYYNLSYLLEEEEDISTALSILLIYIYYYY